MVSSGSNSWRFYRANLQKWSTSNIMSPKHHANMEQVFNTATVITITNGALCFGCLLFVTHITIAACCRRRKNVHNYGLRRKQRYPIVPVCTFLGLVCFIASAVSQVIRFREYVGSNFDIGITISAVTCMTSWSLGHFFSYLVFFLRLTNAFSDSIYALPKYTVIYLVSLLICYFPICWITKSTILFLFWSDRLSPLTLEQFEYVMNIPILILDVLLSISMTYIFVSRLLAIMRTQTDIEHKGCHLRLAALDQSLKFNGFNRKLMNLSVKTVVLSTTSLFASLILMSYDAVAFYFHLSTIAVLPLYLWLQIDTLISCLCLTLCFVEAERAYRLLCCCCVSIGKRCMRRALHYADYVSDY